LRSVLLLSLGLFLAACASHDDSAVVRGRGLAEARLPVAEQAEIYSESLQASFDVGPGLSLLLDPRMLPREAGYGAGPALSGAVVRAAIATGTFQGTCHPTTPARETMTPRCTAPIPGYVVRVSPIFHAAGDTLQVYAASARYDTKASGSHQAFVLEEAYQLVRRGGHWEVARKARLTS